MNIDRLTDIYLRIFPLKIIKYHNYRTMKFIKNIADKYDEKGKKLIDIGAEECPYRQYFRHMKYFAQDIKQNKEKTIDFIGDINKGLSKIGNKSFDYILCTQVLEHLNEPQLVFKEFYRILKTGGKVFLTTHMCYDEHMVPYDYYRFTKYGLRYLGESNGFIVEHIAPHGGVFQVIARILNTIPIKLFFQSGYLYYIYIIVATIPIIILNSLCYLLDFLDVEKTMTLNYECIYKKP